MISPLATGIQNATAAIDLLLEGILGVGTRAKTSSNYVIERRQDPDDPSAVTQKLTLEMSGKHKSPCVSMILQVTAPEVSIRKVLAV